MGDFNDPSWGFIDLLDWVTGLRETPLFTSLLKGVIKDTVNSQVKRYIDRARPGRIPSIGVFLPVEWVTFPMWMCSTTWEVSKTPLKEFRKVSSCRHYQLLPPFPALLPSLGDE